MKEREVSRSEREANIVYNNTFEDIKKAIFQKKNKEYELKIYEIVEELESIFHETKEGSVNLKNEKNQYQTIIEEQAEKIHELRAKLLESTQNNINTIFHSELSSQQILNREINQLKIQVGNLVSQKTNKQENNRIIREEKLYEIISNYEVMIKEYKNKEQILRLLKTGQSETNTFFMELRRQLLESIDSVCENKHGIKIKEIEEKLFRLIEKINIPEPMSPDKEEYTEKFLKQIARLNQIITNKEVTIENYKKKIDDLEHTLFHIQQQQIQIQRVNDMEYQLKKRNARIHELQNTIIDHIGSQAKSMTERQVSFDPDSQMRNYKTLVKNLRFQNENLKEKLINFTNNSENITSFDKINQDQYTETVISDIILILIDERQHSCRCLEKVTEMLMENFQSFQQILVNFGLVETSSNLIAFPVNELVNM